MTNQALVFEESWGAEVEAKVRSTMETLHEWVALSEEIEDIADLPDIVTPSGAPYDGCDICNTREIMYLSMVLALEGQREGLIELE